MVVLKWNAISPANILSDSGIYAWYYAVSIGDHDVNRLIQSLNSCVDVSVRYEAVREFIDKYLFAFFREETYQAHIYGKLMPEFRGMLEHMPQSSNDLVEKIVANPNILIDLQRVLNEITMEFSSPIYIGMSENLSNRVNRHKQLIEQFKRQKVAGKEFEDRDESFAARVVSRGMIETKLKVALMYVSSDNNLHNIMENVLNRINYPVLGRN